MKKENQIVPVESVKTATVEGEVGKEPFGILGFQHEGSVLSIAFSHDSKYIAAGGFDNKLTVYDLTSKAQVHEFQHYIFQFISTSLFKLNDRLHNLFNQGRDLTTTKEQRKENLVFVFTS